MPCIKQITQSLREQIYEDARPALGMSLESAKALIDSINQKYGYDVVGLVQGDVLDLNVYVPLELADIYYENGNLVGALNQWRQVIRLEPENIQVLKRIKRIERKIR